MKTFCSTKTQIQKGSLSIFIQYFPWRSNTFNLMNIFLLVRKKEKKEKREKERKKTLSFPLGSFHFWGSGAEPLREAPLPTLCIHHCHVAWSSLTVSNILFFSYSSNVNSTCSIICCEHGNDNNMSPLNVRMALERCHPKIVKSKSMFRKEQQGQLPGLSGLRSGCPWQVCWYSGSSLCPVSVCQALLFHRITLS